MEYIKSRFGMTYTQDESYYILDADGGGIYLGLKENINFNEMVDDLKLAQDGKRIFDADKYINYFPAKKHDHF